MLSAHLKVFLEFFKTQIDSVMPKNFHELYKSFEFSLLNKIFILISFTVISNIYASCLNTRFFLYNCGSLFFFIQLNSTLDKYKYTYLSNKFLRYALNAYLIFTHLFLSLIFFIYTFILYHVKAKSSDNINTDVFKKKIRQEICKTNKCKPNCMHVQQANTNNRWSYDLFITYFLNHSKLSFFNSLFNVLFCSTEIIQFSHMFEKNNDYGLTAIYFKNDSRPAAPLTIICLPIGGVMVLMRVIIFISRFLNLNLLIIGGLDGKVGSRLAATWTSNYGPELQHLCYPYKPLPLYEVLIIGLKGFYLTLRYNTFTNTLIRCLDFLNVLPKAVKSPLKRVRAFSLPLKLLQLNLKYNRELKTNVNFSYFLNSIPDFYYNKEKHDEKFLHYLDLALTDFWQEYGDKSGAMALINGFYSITDNDHDLEQSKEFKLCEVIKIIRFFATDLFNDVEYVQKCMLQLTKDIVKVIDLNQHPIHRIFAISYGGYLLQNLLLVCDKLHLKTQIDHLFLIKPAISTKLKLPIYDNIRLINAYLAGADEIIPSILFKSDEKAYFESVINYLKPYILNGKNVNITMYENLMH